MLLLMFFAVWLLRTLFEMVWMIMPTSFLGSTFGITNNAKTEDDCAKEKSEVWGGNEHET
jgi:hypothetical protein